VKYILVTITTLLTLLFLAFDEADILTIYSSAGNRSCPEIKLASLQCLGDSSMYEYAKNKNNLLIVNSSYERTKTKNVIGLGDNIIYLNDGISYSGDDVNTLFFNLKKPEAFLLFNKIDSSHHKNFDETKIDPIRPINYLGNAESFSLVGCSDIESAIANKSVSKNILVFGYLGNSASLPNITNDTLEVQSTPKGEMYQTVILANVLGSLTRDELISEQSLMSSIILILILLAVNIFFIRRVRNKSNPYIRFKLLQLLQIIVLIFLSYLVLSIFDFLIGYNFISFVILIILELYYWISLFVKTRTGVSVK
jgi:hypothetical protein